MSTKSQRREEGSRTIDLPQGVTASVKERELTMKGPNGSASKAFTRIPVDIEVKGIGASTGTVCLTPNEKRVAEDRPDCYWLYVVTNCESEQPLLNEPIPNPAKMPWIEVKKVDHFYLTLSAIAVASTDPRLYPDGGKKA